MLNKAFKYSPHEDTDHTGVYMHNHKHVKELLYVWSLIHT